MYVRPFWSKTPRRESVRQGQCPRREHSSQFVPACGSVVGDHAEPRPTLGVIAIVRGGSRTADEHTAPGTLPRKLATRRAGSSSRTRLLRGRPAPPPSKPHSWAALVEREILEHGGGAGPMHPDRPRGGRDDEGIRSPAHTLLRCLASQPNRPRRTCNRIGGPALPRLRESPMCLPAARSAAACNRTRAVARVGGAATGADAPVAADGTTTSRLSADAKPLNPPGGAEASASPEPAPGSARRARPSLRQASSSRASALLVDLCGCLEGCLLACTYGR